MDLAKLGSEEAMDALKQVLAAGESYLKAAIAEGMGLSAHPDAQKLLVELANGRDEITARAAVRGLALRGDSQAVDTLTKLLFDPAKPESIRTEAALALGEIHHPGGLEALKRASNELNDEIVVESVLDGLARRPFSETEAFFTGLLESADQSGADKAMILDALGKTPGEVAPLLLKYAADPNPEVRAAAVGALNAAQTDAAIGPPLADLLAKESAAEVRKLLYQVLSGREDYDVEAVLRLAERELDPAAQIAALGWVAAAAHDGRGDARVFFDTTAVPILRNVALTAASAERRLAAVLALRRAETEPTAAALREIAGRSPDPRVVQAARLARPRR
jgi:HEAT repeat protein